MVAIDHDGTQIGWTLMCSPSAVIMKQFAFPPLMESKDKTGLIGCVGVKEEFRGQGVASLLVSEAIQNLQKRGVEGVFIDWVAKEGLYERMGFETVFEYEQYVWGGALEGVDSGA